MKSLEEMKKELASHAEQFEGLCELPTGGPAGVELATPYLDRDAYVSWWTQATERLGGGQTTRTEVRQEAPKVVQKSLSPATIGMKRVFYDHPTKGLIALYEKTHNIFTPLYQRKPDGHLGAVEGV